MERLVAEGIVERKWGAFVVSSDRYQTQAEIHENCSGMKY